MDKATEGSHKAIPTFKAGSSSSNRKEQPRRNFHPEVHITASSRKRTFQSQSKANSCTEIIPTPDTSEVSNSDKKQVTKKYDSTDGNIQKRLGRTLPLQERRLRSIEDSLENEAEVATKTIHSQGVTAGSVERRSSSLGYRHNTTTSKYDMYNVAHTHPNQMKLKPTINNLKTPSSVPKPHPVTIHAGHSLGIDSSSRKEHRNFVNAVFMTGLKAASPQLILESMSSSMKEKYPDIQNLERIKSKLQKYRGNKMQSVAEFMGVYDAALNLMCETISDSSGHRTKNECVSLADPTLGHWSLFPAKDRSKLMLSKDESIFTSGEKAAYLTYSVLSESSTNTTGDQSLNDEERKLPAMGLMALRPNVANTTGTSSESQNLNTFDGTSDRLADITQHNITPCTSDDNNSCIKLYLPTLTESEKEGEQGKVWGCMAHLFDLMRDELLRHRAFQATDKHNDSVKNTEVKHGTYQNDHVDCHQMPQSKGLSDGASLLASLMHSHNNSTKYQIATDHVMNNMTTTVPPALATVRQLSAISPSPTYGGGTSFNTTDNSNSSFRPPIMNVFPTQTHAFDIGQLSTIGGSTNHDLADMRYFPTNISKSSVLSAANNGNILCTFTSPLQAPSNLGDFSNKSRASQMMLPSDTNDSFTHVEGYDLRHYHSLSGLPVSKALQTLLTTDNTRPQISPGFNTTNSHNPLNGMNIQMTGTMGDFFSEKQNGRRPFIPR